MGRFRDAITGFFTTKAHAKANPDTTVRETIRRPPELGRRLRVSDLSGVHPVTEQLGRQAAVELIRRSGDTLRSGSTVTMKGATLQTGLRVVMTVQVLTPEVEDAGQADG